MCPNEWILVAVFERPKQIGLLTGDRSQEWDACGKNENWMSEVVEYLQILIECLQMRDISLRFSQMFKLYY